MMSDIEDYEALRERNISERNAFLKEFLKEIKEDTVEINNLESKRLSISQKENKTSKSVTKNFRSVKNSLSRHQSSHVHFEFPKKYNTRSKKRKYQKMDEGGINNNDDGINDDNDIIVPKKGSSLKVMFSWSRPIQRDIDLMRFDFSEEENDNVKSDDKHYIYKRKKKFKMSKSVYNQDNIPSPNEITEEMLKNVAVKASGKYYDAVNGTCCHQCRQKTKDTKTVCRSGECIGVRGQFCGPCLLGRYGESAVDALQDPNWICPPCRDLCNCSICRTRNGQRPTGILAPLAKEEGYDSVKDYLQAMDYED